MAWHMERQFDSRPGWAHASAIPLLEGLTVEQATWRPAPGRRCIWELVRHMLGWRRFVAGRMEGDEDTTPGDEWPPIPPGDAPDLEAQWRADLDELRSTTERIVAGLRATAPEARHPHPDCAHLPLWISPLGVQIHDAYHLGQIAMLRGLQGLDPME